MKVIGSTVFVFPHPPPSIVIPRSTLGLLTCFRKHITFNGWLYVYVSALYVR